MGGGWKPSFIVRLPTKPVRRLRHAACFGSPNLGQFGWSSRVVGRRRWTPPPHRRRLVKAKQRIAHALSRRIVRDAAIETTGMQKNAQTTRRKQNRKG